MKSLNDNIEVLEEVLETPETETISNEIVKPLAIVKDLKILNLKSSNVENLEEGEEIAFLLLDTMIRNKDLRAVGLSAIQLGIPKNVFVVNVTEPLIFINPEIVEASYETVQYKEGCVSFPNSYVKTSRRINIKVKALNFEGVKEFGIKDLKNIEKDYRSDELLEAIAIQHEFDHLLGLTMYDRKIKPTTVINEMKIGRNEIVSIKNTKTETVLKMKYKKALVLLQEVPTEWTLLREETE